MTTNQPPAEAVASELLSRPILNRALVNRRPDGSPYTGFTSGAVAALFFNRGADWIQQRIYRKDLPETILPPTPEIGGGRLGRRSWTLPDVEVAAFHLWKVMPDFDVLRLLLVLDVVYSAARLQGLLPMDADPLAELRHVIR